MYILCQDLETLRFHADVVARAFTCVNLLGLAYLLSFHVYAVFDATGETVVDLEFLLIETCMRWRLAESNNSDQF